jgi:hypothetical protein
MEDVDREIVNRDRHWNEFICEWEKEHGVSASGEDSEVLFQDFMVWEENRGLNPGQ